MTSFVDLMASDVWTEADIKTRLHAMIRSQFSAEVEEELSRAVMGAMLGQHQITAEEGAKLARFKALTDQVALVGAAARADWALLRQVMEVEAAQRRLDQPTDDSEPDLAERAAAQAVLDAAGPQVLEWVEKRRPAAAEVRQ